MTFNSKFKKPLIITMICTLLLTFSLFTNQAYAMQQPEHKLVKVETQVLATDPNSPDNQAALLVALLAVVPAVQGAKRLSQVLAYIGLYFSTKTWISGLNDAPNSFTVKKYIYQADKIKNNNYWGYYYITVTNKNTGETVTSKTFPIAKMQ